MLAETDTHAKQPPKQTGYDSFELQNLTPHMGAEVHGLDLSAPLDAKKSQDLDAAFCDWKVLIFRDQTLTRSLADGPSNNRGHHASSLPALCPLPSSGDPVLPWRLQGNSVLPAAGFLDPERRGCGFNPDFKEAHRRGIQANRLE